jgi:CRP/FNR family transcriptional regulator
MSLSNLHAGRGYSGSEFNLSMSRQDIASFLALAVETVSRLFTQFQNQGLIRVDRRHIQLLAPEALNAKFGSARVTLAG